MYGFENLNANTGWIGSGFLNAGFAGMLIYAVIIGILFSLLNAYANFSDKRIVVAIMIGPTLTVMMSSDLPTAFLNHGVLLGVILLSFFTATKTLKDSRTHS
jgi:fructose-specific phosphotransferase system IIC component